MQEIIKQVKHIVADELERANDEFPLFHSKHEAIGVLLEEVAEASDEIESFNSAIISICESTFKDDDDNMCMYRTYARSRAMFGIAELVQCVAMLDKWDQSEQNWNEMR